MTKKVLSQRYVIFLCILITIVNIFKNYLDWKLII